MVLTVEFCGEAYVVDPAEPFVVGRDGHLAIDENPYLHRHFLQIVRRDSLWWLANMGSRLTATLSDENGAMQAWLAPGAFLPLMFPRTMVWFTAGPTTYEFDIVQNDAPFTPAQTATTEVGVTTIGRTNFTPDQMLLIVSLSEHALQGGIHGARSIPSSADAASRLGWTLTKFNRKLDNVCQKLTKRGVRGLHGGPESLAVNRRARLVEYALATRLVTRTDLDLLDS
jgi:hypothetical protein